MHFAEHTSNDTHPSLSCGSKSPTLAMTGQWESHNHTVNAQHPDLPRALTTVGTESLVPRVTVKTTEMQKRSILKAHE